MRIHRKDCRGFTLIELIASITIVAILAAVMLPRMTTGQVPFLERGYADGIAASLRQSRAVAVASGCDVQFTIDAAGYRAFQRVAGAGNHCATAGAWATPVWRGDGRTLLELEPAGVVLAAGRQFVFSGTTGLVVAGPVNISVGPLALVVNASGVVQGP